MQEEALLFGPNNSNAGVFTAAVDNTHAQSEMACICITAGLLHHVGPHRLHVLLARSLAEEGISTLRFDISGIGDSLIRSDDFPANEAPVQEINSAMKVLEKRGFTRFVLFGICSGAVQAVKVAAGNSKVAGIILVNTGADTGETETEANPQEALQFYLKRSLFNLKAWRNLFTGKIKYRALFITLFFSLIYKLKNLNKKIDTFEDKLDAEITPYIEQGTSILMVMSDRHAQYYELQKQAFDKLLGERFKILVYTQADHLFTPLSVQKDVIHQVCLWSRDLVAIKTSSAV